MHPVFSNHRLWIAFAVFLLIDLAFQLGAYEPLVARDSHAGSVLRSLNALEIRGAADVDTVTLGSSVANFGLDHSRIAARARALGHGYANFAHPGSALLALRQWGQWLPKHAPSVRSGIWVLAPDDLQFLGNGSYELALVAPLKSLGDGFWWQEHVPFDARNLDSYGLFSGLALYRNDVQQLSAHPNQRKRELGWWRKQLRKSDYLIAESTLDGDVCALDLSSVAACLANPRPASMTLNDFAAIQKACADLQAKQVLPPADWRIDANVPAQTRRAEQLARDLITQLQWQNHALVLVLPTHPLWTSARPIGASRRMVDTFKAQQEAGQLRYLDYQNLFTNAGVPACRVFHDMYHLNRFGQKMVTDALLPELAWLYRRR
jgi:hypothetical protein